MNGRYVAGGKVRDAQTNVSRTTEIDKCYYTSLVSHIGHRNYSNLIMRPSSVGGGRIFRRTLSVCLSVRPVRGSSFVIVYITAVLRANIQNRKTSVFDYRPASTLRTCGIFCFVYLNCCKRWSWASNYGNCWGNYVDLWKLCQPVNGYRLSLVGRPTLWALAEIQ